MTIARSFEDTATGARGWLAYDGETRPLAVGGCRVQRRLTAGMVEALAERMTLEERVLGLNVDGAKCGLHYDPTAPGKAAALRRFLGFLRDELETRLSLGCDVGTQWHELERLAVLEGIPSIKIAIRKAQGLTDEDFFHRLGLLDERVGTLTLAEHRAGHGLACAAVAAARATAGAAEGARCALQGFGNLGRGAAQSLAEHGVVLVAVADEHGYAADPDGLDVERLLAAPYGTPVAAGATALPREALAELPCDVLVLAATENAIPADQAARIQAPAVVVGANCGLAEEVEEALRGRGILVVPDFIGGIGGSASMEALFGSVRPPASAGAVLERTSHLMRELVDDLIETARREDVSVRSVALELAASRAGTNGERPYGACPYLAATVGMG
jgi:glutamate dehydrogenase/leucine dehydrogenase